MKNIFPCPALARIVFAFAIVVTGITGARADEAEVLRLQKDYELHADGSISQRVTQSVRFDRHHAFDKFGETFIVYNPLRQKLKIEEAFTTQPDGTVVKTPERAFNEVLPAFAADAPAYNYLREMVVSHTGIEIGAVANLTYTLTSEAGFWPELDVVEALRQDAPVREYVITARVPETKKLSSKLYNFAGEPTIKTENGTTLYTWRFENLPAWPKEKMQSGNDAPRLLFSTWKSQEEAIRWLAGKMQLTAKKSSPARKKIFGDFAKATLHDYNDDGSLKSAALVFNKVDAGITCINIPPALTGFQFRIPETVLQSAYGTPAEKMCAIITAAEIPITYKTAYFTFYPAAIYPRWFDGAVGSLTAGETFESANCFFESEKPFYSMQEPVFGFMPESDSPAKKTKHPSVINAKITLTGCSAKLAGTVGITGKLNPIFALITDDNAAKNLLSAGDTSEAKFTAESSPQDVQIAITAAMPITESAGYFSFELPEIKGGAGSFDLAPALIVKRETALAVPYPADEYYSYEIEIPKEKRAVNRDTIIEKNNVAGYLRIESKTEAGKLKISRRLFLKKTAVSPADYPAFAELMRLWLEKNHRTVVLAETENS